MLAIPPGVRVHLALGGTDMRKGFDGLVAQVQTVLREDPFSGHVFAFRGRRGGLVKLLVWTATVPATAATQRQGSPNGTTHRITTCLP